MPTLWPPGSLVVPNELWFLAFMILCSSFPLWLWTWPCDQLWLMGQQQAWCKCRPCTLRLIFLDTPSWNEATSPWESPRNPEKNWGLIQSLPNSSQGPTLTTCCRNEAMLCLLAILVPQFIPYTSITWSTHRITRNNKLNYIVVFKTLKFWGSLFYINR